MNTETFTELFDLKGEILVPRLAAKLKPKARLIYFCCLGFICLLLLATLGQLILGRISFFVIYFALAILLFVMSRMFCEFIMNYESPKDKK